MLGSNEKWTKVLDILLWINLNNVTKKNLSEKYTQYDLIYRNVKNVTQNTYIYIVNT